MKKIIKLIIVTVIVLILCKVVTCCGHILYNKVLFEADLGFLETAYKFYEPIEKNEHDYDALAEYICSDEAENAIEDTRKAAEEALLKLDNCNFFLKMLENHKETDLEKFYNDRVKQMESLVAQAKKAKMEGNMQSFMFTVEVYGGSFGGMIKDNIDTLKTHFDSSGKYNWKKFLYEILNNNVVSFTWKGEGKNI